MVNNFVAAQQLALIFAHTEKYPDEPPLLNVSRSVFIYHYCCLYVQLMSTAVHMFLFQLLYTHFETLLLYFTIQNSLQGISSEDLRILKDKLQQEVIFNHMQFFCLLLELSWSLFYTCTCCYQN